MESTRKRVIETGIYRKIKKAAIGCFFFPSRIQVLNSSCRNNT